MKENRLVIKRSGTEGAAGEEIWMLQGEHMRWCTRAELLEFPEKIHAALTLAGFTVTLQQIKEAL